MNLTIVILMVLALYVLQIFLQETSRFGFDIAGILGNRDKLPDQSVVAGRLDRAKNNLLEALPIFLTLALLAIVKGGEMTQATQGAQIFLIARVLYVPAYLSGVPVLRSLMWLVGMGGLVLMAITLI